ncbi:MAG: 2-C-methyl-D-erythritol 4-phosphate cytidylyltransferase [Erysipelotrichaceae bacterium]|nr:2-C-methyl-D-erythritol 4-phosphate cytidylyltransferase [Erysipelotrichaceae bacterium]
MKYDAIIVASGKGQRANLGYNKVFYKLKDGRSVLDCSIAKFADDPDCYKIIVVTNPEYFHEVKGQKVTIVEGGKERRDSVYNGLKKVESEYVLIHDGARPYLHIEALNELKEKLSQNDCVVLGKIATDTIKLIEEDTVVETIDRNKIFQAETPQGFKSELIKNAYENCADINFTDDCSLVESLGYKVRIVIDRFDNKKLTKEEDFLDL